MPGVIPATINQSPAIPATSLPYYRFPLIKANLEVYQSEVRVLPCAV
jgi:hypothetical protein